MLLTLTDVELCKRPGVYDVIIREATGSSYSITRSPIGPHQVSIQFSCSGETDDAERVLSDRRDDEWAIPLSIGKSFSLFLAFDENWHKVPPKGIDWRRLVLSEQLGLAAKNTRGRAGKTQDSAIWVFAGLHMRFYVRLCDAGAPSALYQWLRCEWEPYDFSQELANEGAPTIATQLDAERGLHFNAGVAAHPHFHFDSVPLSISGRKAGGFHPESASEGGFSSFVSPLQTLIVRDGLLRNDSSFLHHLHLPTITQWQQTPVVNSLEGYESTAKNPLPHQHYPKSAEELQQWFGWCLSYFVHQFYSYIADH